MKKEEAAKNNFFLSYKLSFSIIILGILLSYTGVFVTATLYVGIFLVFLGTFLVLLRLNEDYKITHDQSLVYFLFPKTKIYLMKSK